MSVISGMEEEILALKSGVQNQEEARCQLEELVKAADVERREMEQEHAKEKGELGRLKKDLAIRME